LVYSHPALEAVTSGGSPPEKGLLGFYELDLGTDGPRTMWCYDD